MVSCAIVVVIIISRSTGTGANSWASDLDLMIAFSANLFAIHSQVSSRRNRQSWINCKTRHTTRQLWTYSAHITAFYDF